MVGQVINPVSVGWLCNVRFCFGLGLALGFWWRYSYLLAMFLGLGDNASFMLVTHVNLTDAILSVSALAFIAPI